MKIVISPAKSLDYKSTLPDLKQTSQPIFLNQAEILTKKLASKSKNDIKTLMHLSDNLTELNYQRYQDFSVPFTPDNARPAVYAFSGDVYTGLDVYTLPKDKIAIMNQRLRILSGLYGVLKPLDLMQEYRLEMGTQLQINRKKNLYEFWANKVTDALNDELEEDELFINLASQEYFKVINSKTLKVPVITPVFKDFKNGTLKVISFFAKKARGSMVRYIIDNEVNTIEELKEFTYGGYIFSEEYTLADDTPVFIR